MEKFLATKVLENELNPFDTYSFIKSNLLYTNKFDERYARICPYIIILDGSECIIFDNAHKQVEIGFACSIDKVAHKASFEDLMDLAIHEAMSRIFSSITTREFGEVEKAESVNKNIPKDLPLGREIAISPDELAIHSTNRAFYSLDKTMVFPVYFLVLPNNRPITLKTAKGMPNCHTTFLDSLVKNGLAKYKLSNIAKTVLVMIGSGEIVLPIIAENGEDITRV